MLFFHTSCVEHNMFERYEMNFLLTTLQAFWFLVCAFVFVIAGIRQGVLSRVAQIGSDLMHVLTALKTPVSFGYLV